MSREFLGHGWRFPVETDDSGAIQLSAGERDIREAIFLIVGTAKGERVMRPDFGCGIHEYAFATMDAATRTKIERSVEDALIEWEPRIEVLDVDTSLDDIDSGVLLVAVEYRVRSTNNEFNLVYPFYLEEA